MKHDFPLEFYSNSLSRYYNLCVDCELIHSTWPSTFSSTTAVEITAYAWLLSLYIHIHILFAINSV